MPFRISIISRSLEMADHLFLSFNETHIAGEIPMQSTKILLDRVT